MARLDSKKGGEHYLYNLGYKAILKNGKVVDTYQDTKDNLAEIIHFTVQNSNYTHSELGKMDIRELLGVFEMVEKDISRKIANSK